MLGEVYVAERTMGSCLEERRSRLEARRQVRQLRSNDRASGQLYRRLAVALAHQLVAAGARLVSYGLPPYHPVSGESNGEGRGTIAV